MVWLLLSISVSFLLGSIPFSFILGKVSKGVDIRRYGSGNVGATNVFRIAGKLPGILALILDTLKGVGAIYIGWAFSSQAVGISPDIFRLSSGLSGICGHLWTPFLRLKGGKGVATTLGVLIGLCQFTKVLYIVLIIMLFVWVVAFLLLRRISISSISASVALPVTMAMSNSEPDYIYFVIFAIIVCILIVLRHRTNIRRIIAGEERRVF